MRKKVTVYTQAYNTRPYLEQCISSVLSQTYPNFEYILVDNGSTDGSSEILRNFTKMDNRIRLIRFEENQYYPRLKIMEELASGEYYATLDSDDWWEPDYLERLVGFLEANDLDLAVTGTCQYIEETQTSQTMRKLQSPIVLTQKEFARLYPSLWIFPSTVWACVMKLSIAEKIRDTNINNIAKKRYPYGGDTMEMLYYIRQCARIGIDNSALYHYRIHPKSVSYRYNSRRFDANIAYYEQIKEFLELHHTFDAQKQVWLKQVHLSSMKETLRLLRDAKMPEDEKIAECARIVGHPLTAFALTGGGAGRAEWFDVMWEIVLRAMAGKTLSDAESLHRTLEVLAPGCCGGIMPENWGIFAKEPPLCEALRHDDPARLRGLVLELIAQGRYTKQYDLGQLLGGLLPAGSPLRGIADTRFWRKYARPCALILQGERLAALDEMTELLLQGGRLYEGERFLNVYLSLAALENQAPAFLFGKLQMAKLLLCAGRREESRAVAEELAEMGLENEEFSALCRELEQIAEEDGESGKDGEGKKGGAQA